MGGTIRHPYDDGLVVADRVVVGLGSSVDRAEIAGSIRRHSPDVGDVDIVVIPTENESAVRKQFRAMTADGRLTMDGDHICVGVVDGIPVNLFFTSPESWGAAIFYATGPREYNICVRLYARACGLRVNEKGIFRIRGDARISDVGETEESMPRYLGIPFLAPEERGLGVFAHHMRGPRVE